MKINATQLSSRIDRDKLMMMNRDTAAAAAFTLLDPILQMKPEEQLAAVAVAFAAVAERSQMDAAELHAFGLKVLTAPRPHHRNGNALVDALQDYAKLKVRNDPKF